MNKLTNDSDFLGIGLWEQCHLLHGTVLRVSFHFKNKMNFALAVNKCEKVSSSEAKASLAGPEPASGSAYTPKA